MSETFTSLLSVAMAMSVAASSGTDSPSGSAAPPETIAHLSAAPYPETVTTELEYAQWLENETRRLLSAAGQEAPLQERIEFRLAAVNWMLATQSEPPMSRLLQQLTLPDDNSFMANLTQRALAEIATAKIDLKLFDESPDRTDELVGQLADTIDALECFGQALRISAAPKADADEARRIAAELSLYLEDDRPDVAASALIWQAVLYEKSDRLDRAMRSLPLALTPAHADTMEYDYFSRLLRCRLLGKRGSFATAWSLILLLEERSRDWFGVQSRRNEATNSAVLTKLNLCDAWTEASDGTARDRTREWCRANDARLRKEYLSTRADGAMLRLATAAPNIVNVPESAKTDDPVDDAANADDQPTSDDETPQ